MNGMKHIYLFIMLLVTLLAISCADDDRQAADNIPDGYGKLIITISTPEAAQTRAVNTTIPWLQGTGEARAITSYHLLVCSGNTILQAISGDAMALGAHEADPKNYFPSTGTITTDILPVDTYDFTFYCLANFTSEMLTATGLTISNGKVTNTELPANFETKVMQPIANGIVAVPTTGLPMTGKLTQNSVSIARRTTTTINDPIILWRMMAKLEFQFTNGTSSDVKVLGIEVEPINQATAANGSGVYLISQDNLASEANLAPHNYSETAREIGVAATWAMNTAPLTTTATASRNDVFSTITLTNGNKLTPTETRPVDGESLYKFAATEDLGEERNNDAYIAFTVTPTSGMTFSPRSVSFKACRGGTDAGYFDVVVENGGTSTNLATKVRPERYNVAPYMSSYSYSIDGTHTSGNVVVKIYVYNLANGKDYAFGDVTITGVVKTTETVTQEKITLPTAALTDVGPVTYTPASSEQTIAGNGGTRSIYFYVNETDASFTTTSNQLSLRFKIQRNGYTEEVRYGVTIHHDLTDNGIYGGERGGFNVIRRNDWIHIPIHIRDWQFRIEPVAFVPIAGYPAKALSSDGLSATFSTGGPIILKLFAQKNNDGTWRDFSDPEVTFVSLSWKNSDGSNVSGTGKILEYPLAYDPVTKCITGVLNNSLSAGTYMTTVTVNTKLGPTGSQFDYSFTFNVVLKKE